MKRRPWFKFHTQDWRADPALRMCSPAARGLWADMLSLMHEAEPYGFLLVGGVAPSSKKLATLLSIDADLIGTLIGDLEENGVFSRDAEGVIYSRRMVRDAEIADDAREHIAKRWGKSAKSKGVTSAPIRSPNRDPMPENGVDPITKSQSQKSEEAAAPLRARATHDTGLWTARLTDATERAGKALRGTNPACKVYTALRNICEPAAGAPCDWEADVLPAIDVVAARAIRANRQFDTWEYVAQAALENRDKRLAGVPDPKPIPLNGNGHAARGRESMSAVIDRVFAEEEAKLEQAR
jgi:hypothetical protein